MNPPICPRHNQLMIPLPSGIWICPNLHCQRGAVSTSRTLEGEIAELQIKIAALEVVAETNKICAENLGAQNAELRETLAASEEYRRAYQQGKQELYAMGEPFTSAAMEHLPCGEGALDRRFRELIEIPRIKKLEEELQEARRKALGDT